jgi:hypothetical protein
LYFCLRYFEGFTTARRVCETARGRCTIKARKQSEIREGPNVYTVEFENGLSAELLETELTLVESRAATAPLDALIALEQEGYFVFEKRAELVGAYQQMMRGGMGLRALLSSRIDLLPHQAYVAGVILLDRQQRYLLADKVGLGKTIEAGIVIHDVLGRNPDARILVLCPGALTQQWLCELYSKFSGRVFQLPEIRGTRWAQENAWRQTILSFFGAKRMLDQLLKAAWDLVVVDEAHHLLAAPELYALARQLSQNSEGFLLLSALPAQHREEEYLRLLALLQPAHYDPEAAGAVERFRLLYERQRQIGTRLGWISRRLPEVMTGERDAQSVLDKVAELAQWPVLQQYQKLQALFERIDPSGRSFDDDVRAVLHHVGDTHRINRRILRNRRARLIQEQQVKPIERRLNSLKYDPDQLELDALEYAHRFLFGLQERGLSEQVLLPLARQLLQAAADPATLFAFLQIAARPKEECEKGADVEAFELDSLSGYAEWPKYAATRAPRAADEEMCLVRCATAQPMREEKAPRDRLAGAGPKSPSEAVVKSHGREHRRKRSGKGSDQIGDREMNESEPLMTCRNVFQMRSKPGGRGCPGISMDETCFGPCGLRHEGGMTLLRGGSVERGNLPHRCDRALSNPRASRVDA